jgi:hypothetical protein
MTYTKTINDYINMSMPVSAATGAYDIEFLWFQRGQVGPVANLI